jgi:hypothetical protein
MTHPACALCAGPAVLLDRATGAHYCADHLADKVEEAFRAALRGPDGLRSGERVAVAFSGGKDSSVLLHLLATVAAPELGLSLAAVTIDEGIAGYREQTVAWARTLAARLARLAVTALLSAVLIIPAVGLVTGVWPDSLLLVAAILLPLAVAAGCVGVLYGLAFRATLPAFFSALVTAFGSWIVGDAFKPAAAVGGWYESASMLTPNHYAIHALFPRFYGTGLGGVTTAQSLIVLSAAAVAGMAAAVIAYRRRVAEKG